MTTTLQGLERKGLIRVHRTPVGKAEAVNLIPARQRLSKL